MKLIQAVLVALFSTLLILSPNSSNAMNFTMISLDGREVLLASGSIEFGDAQKYMMALSQTPLQPHGARIVVLDSPGGSVDEALAMSDVNREFVVHTYIPNGASCASACASILFISGDFRTMAPSGRFGQHSCSRRGVADDTCNELLAMHATEHGVAHGAVKAFVSYVPPDDILWLNDTDLDCWAISLFPFSKQSGFERFDPCIFQQLNGRKPGGQSVWRVEMKSDGYRAFARSVADDARDFELGLYCDETQPGQLFLEFDISGPVEAIRSALTSGHLIVGENQSVEVQYSLRQIDNGYTRAELLLPKSMVREILTSTDRLGARFEVVEGFSPLHSWVSTATSREALLFVANHCVNRLVN